MENKIVEPPLYMRKMLRTSCLNRINELTQRIIILKKTLKFDRTLVERSITPEYYVDSNAKITVLWSTDIPKDATYFLSWDKSKKFTKNELRSILSKTKQELKEAQKELSKIDNGIATLENKQEFERLQKIEELSEDIALKEKELKQLKQSLKTLKEN